MIFSLIALALAAQQTPPLADPPPAKPSAQGRFDAATAAASAGKWQEAYDIFAALEAKSGKQAPAVQAVIRIRKGLALLELDRNAEAGIALRSGLESLPSDPKLFLDDRHSAMIGLGRLAYADLDYAAARAQFGGALPLANAANARFETLLWLIRASMFDEGPQAQAWADEALKMAESSAKINKDTLAGMRTLHARVLLNHGQKRPALAELRKALADQGGLKLKVTLEDIATRSDLAIAALLNGNTDDARKYLAYTGAGRFKKAPFATAAAMAPPPCGGAADLRPEDIVVVEFGLGDDGAVTVARPVYASRLGPGAVEYARAVRNWSWRPEDARAIPAFFKLLTRVEMRCSTSLSRPSVRDILRGDFDDWLAERGIAPADKSRGEAASVEPLRAELKRREAAGGGLQLVPVLMALGENPVTNDEESRAWFIRARDILYAANAPVSVRTYIDAITNGWLNAGYKDRVADYRGSLRALLARPDVAADARTAASLRLLISEEYYRSPAPADAPDLLQAVAHDARLGPSDPLRVNALVRLAGVQARNGDLAGARQSYAKTGLDAQQCALVDTKPALRRSGAGSSDFPMEAMRWGFEGWVRTEFDIAADGKTANQRSIIAYPPFVFRDAAVGVVRDARYQPSYRPEGDPGCSGAQQNISFLLP